MIRATIGIFSQGGVAIDADAQAFFDRVTTAGGSLSTTEQEAVNTLVVQMKSDGIWTKMKAIYPMVGGGNGTLAQNQAACEQNLKSSSFTGSFTAGWTFASTGVTPNGTSAYMDTNCNDNNFSNNSMSFGCYSRINENSAYDLGIYNTTLAAGSFIALRNSNQFRTIVQAGPPALIVSSSDSRGFYQTSKNGSTTVLAYRNSSEIINATKTTENATNTTFYLGALNNGGTPAFGYTGREYCFAYIGDGLSATDMTTYYIRVQAFQTTLSRQV